MQHFHITTHILKLGFQYTAGKVISFLITSNNQICCIYKALTSSYTSVFNVSLFSSVFTANQDSSPQHLHNISLF